MNKYEIKEFLERHYEISRSIDVKLEQIEELKSLAKKVTTGPFTESHAAGGYTDRVGRTTARIVDLEREINEEIDRLVDVREEILGLIYMLSDGISRVLLERRYLLHEGWERIAEKLGYSPRHITRLHNRALEELESVLRGKSA